MRITSIPQTTHWSYRQSIAVIREIMESRMYPIAGPGARDALLEQIG